MLSIAYFWKNQVCGDILRKFVQNHSKSKRTRFHAAFLYRGKVSVQKV
jgi:hypothetical protein